MDQLFVVVLFVHVFSLVLGMGSGIALSVLGRRLAEANADQREALFGLGRVLLRNGHMGLGVLLVSGVAMVLMRYTDLATLPLLFWIKMALVVAMTISVVVGGRAFKQLQTGNADAAKVTKMTGAVSAICGGLIILIALFAFA